MLYEQLIEIVISKYGGKRRGKHSNVAREMNAMLRYYVESNGEIAARTHTDPKERVLSEIDEMVDGCNISKEKIEEVLDREHIVDRRARQQYTAYGKRKIDKIVAKQLGISVPELHSRRSPKLDNDVAGYR